MRINLLLDIAYKKCGSSVTELASRLGVSRQIVHRWLSGQGQPNGQNILNLIDIVEKPIRKRK